MRRNEVWWAELPPPVGPRPVIILTRDPVIEFIDSLVVALVTRTMRGLPTEIRLGRREGLPSPCVANLDDRGQSMGLDALFSPRVEAGGRAERAAGFSPRGLP